MLWSARTPRLSKGSVSVYLKIFPWEVFLSTVNITEQGTYCKQELSFFIFSSYERSECFIAEWNEAASYCGALAKQCFIVRLLWSTAAPYEAARCAMKRTYGAWSEAWRLHFFLPKNLGKKKWSGYGDLNSGPFDPQSNALDQAALYPEHCSIIYHLDLHLSSRFFFFFNFFHRYPQISYNFSKNGHFPWVWTREIWFLKSDSVRFLFLTWIVIQSQTGVALRSVTVEFYYRQAKEQVSIILKHSFYSTTSLWLKR